MVDVAGLDVPDAGRSVQRMDGHEIVTISQPREMIGPIAGQSVFTGHRVPNGATRKGLDGKGDHAWYRCARQSVVDRSPQMAGTVERRLLGIGPEHGHFILHREQGAFGAGRQDKKHGRGRHRGMGKPHHVSRFVGHDALDVHAVAHGGRLEGFGGIENHVRVNDLPGPVDRGSIHGGGQIGSGQTYGQDTRRKYEVGVRKGNGIDQIHGIRIRIRGGSLVGDGDFGAGHRQPGHESILNCGKVAAVGDTGSTVFMDYKSQRQGIVGPVFDVPGTDDRIDTAVPVAVEKRRAFGGAEVVQVIDAVAIEIIDGPTAGPRIEGGVQPRIRPVGHQDLNIVEKRCGVPGLGIPIPQVAEIIGAQADLQPGLPGRKVIGDIEFPAVPPLGSEIEKMVGFPDVVLPGHEPAEENTVFQGQILIDVKRKQNA